MSKEDWKTLTKQRNYKANLKTMTFWDCEIKSLDLDSDKYFIIARVAERGTDSEVVFILEYYSLEDIWFAVNNSPEITIKTLNYYNTIVL